MPEHAPLVVAGDFNDWRGSATALLERELGLAEVFERALGRHARSYPARLPLLALDRIYVFLPAGTIRYWQAWVWLAALFLPMMVSFLYLVKRDPALLERRTRTSETRSPQKWIIGASALYFLVAFIQPWFDVRLGWSRVPAWESLAADGVVIGSYVLYMLVLKTNTFASRVIEVEKGQQVITNGPYALVRHSMYLAMILMMTATPLALGSYWAMLPSILFILLLAARAKNEENCYRRNSKVITSTCKRLATVSYPEFGNGESNQRPRTK